MPEPLALEQRDFDLTMPLDGTVRLPGTDETVIARATLSPDWLQLLSELRVSPHNITHIDLPGCLSWWRAPEGRESTEDDLIAHYACDLTSDCVLIDLPTTRQRMVDALAGVDPKVTVPRSCWTDRGEKLRQLIADGLAITPRDLDGIRFPKGGIAVFVTNWRLFAPADGNLESPNWLPWHPYLLNPYLTPECVEFLFADPAGPQLKGIGCDIHSIEHPLHRLVMASARPPGLTREDEEVLVRAAADCGVDLSDLQNVSIAHRRALHALHSRASDLGRLVIEQLCVPPEIHARLIGQRTGMSRHGKPGSVHAAMTVLPFRCSGQADALPVVVHVRLQEGELDELPVAQRAEPGSAPGIGEALELAGRRVGEWHLAFIVLAAMLKEPDRSWAEDELQEKFRKLLDDVALGTVMRRLEDRGLVSREAASGGPVLRLTSAGLERTRALVNCEARLREDCCEWLAKWVDGADPATLLSDWTAWLQTAELGEIIAAIHSREFPTSVGDSVRRVGLRSAARLGVGPMPPVIQLAVAYLVFRLLTDGAQLARHRLNLLVDTNILLAAINPRDTSHGYVRRALDLMRGAVRTGSVQLFISHFTLMELARSLQKASAGYNSILLAGRGDTKALQVLGQEVVLDFLESRRDPTIRDYSSRKILEVMTDTLANSGLRAQVFWQAVERTHLRKQVERVQGSHRELGFRVPRSHGQDLHDVVVLEIAASRDEDGGEGQGDRWAVWTMHRGLRDIARFLGLDESRLVLQLAVLGHPEIAPPRDELEKIVLAVLTGASESEALTVNVFDAFRQAGGAVHPQVAGQRIVAGYGSAVARVKPEGAAEAEDEEYEPFVAPAEEGWVDLTLDWGRTPGGHGAMPLYVQRRHRAGSPAYGSHSWRFSPHALTHMDLPWALKFDPDSMIGRHAWRAGIHEPYDMASQALYSKLTTPRCMRAVFLDLRDILREAAGSVLKQGGTWQTFSFGGASSDLTGWLTEAIAKLRIKPERLTRDLGENGVKDHVLVLHTGWASAWLQPGTAADPADWSSGNWEVLWPWLLHPWLDVDAATAALGLDPVMLAIDAPMADCPLYIAAFSSPFGALVRTVEETLRSSGKQRWELLTTDQPAHSMFLSSGKPMVESVLIPEVVAGWYAGEPITEADIHIAPLRLPLMMDGAPVKLRARRTVA